MKYQRREVVEAEQWFPDRKVEGVVYPPEPKEIHKLATGFNIKHIKEHCKSNRGSAVLIVSENCITSIGPGDYVVSDEYGYREVWARRSFERDFKPITSSA